MTKSTLTRSTTGGLLLALAMLSPVAAQAQTETTTTTTTTTPPPAVVSNRGSGAGLGVGAAAFLAGPPALNVVYDLSTFHIEGLVSFITQDVGPGDDTATFFQFGVRGWYHLHTGTNSDFSLGGGMGILTNSNGPAPSTTATLIEPGMQARVFLTPNFTLNATAGFTFVFGDAVGNDSFTGYSLGGQLLGGLGLTYFFR